ncbi:hypothetical protein HY498_01575 [Candidatus Woesearchaeota archaeon]|nr:hypothetical protein [Candidatus Woesearchaeota archaeon]
MKEKNIKISLSGKREVSLLVLRDNGKMYKVTRRIPELTVSETRMFKTKKEARKQFNEWLEI